MPSSRARLWLPPLAGLLLVVGLLAATSPVASHVAAQKLAERGVVCDEETFSVHLEMLRGRATVAPTRCRLTRRPGGELELLAPLEVTRRRHVRVPSLRVSLHAPDAKEAHAKKRGPLLQALQLPTKLGALGFVIARIAELPVAALQIDHLEIHHERGLHLTAEKLSVSSTSPRRVQVERVEAPLLDTSFGASARVVLTGTHGTVSKDELRLDGMLAARAKVPLLGRIERELPLWVEVRDLRSGQPSYRFGLAD